MLKTTLIAAVSVATLAMAVPASAQNVLTLSSEQTTTFVRNFNPFGQTSARYTTLDFMYEPLVVFNRLKGNEPNSLIANTIVGMPIVPEHIWADIADPVTFANENPVASGPMTEITRFTPQVYDCLLYTYPSPRDS